MVTSVGLRASGLRDRRRNCNDDQENKEARDVLSRTREASVRNIRTQSETPPSGRTSVNLLR